MKLNELKSTLTQYKDKKILFNIKGKKIEPCFHITEIGKENRDFFDCGGKRRKTEKCVLQVWIGEDKDHRLTIEKLINIIEIGSELFLHEIPDVYIEYEEENVVQYPIDYCLVNEDSVEFFLGKNHTQCLAPEKCGNKCKQQLYSL